MNLGYLLQLFMIISSILYLCAMFCILYSDLGDGVKLKYAKYASFLFGIIIGTVIGISSLGWMGWLRMH